MSDRKIAENTGQVPSIGRIVAFRLSPGGEHHAALVINISGADTVDLKVFYRGGSEATYMDVPMERDDLDDMCWSWPQRVP